MADRKGGKTWNKPNNGSRDGGRPQYTREDFRNALDPNVDLDGEIRSAKKNFLLIEVQNMRTVDTVTDFPEGVLQIIRYDIDDNVKKAFPKGPESIPIGTKVKISARRNTQRADPGSLMLLEDWEKKKAEKKQQNNEKKNENRSQTAIPDNQPERHLRNIPVEVTGVLKDKMILRFKLKGVNKDIPISIYLGNEKTVGIPVRGTMNYWKISEVKNYVAQGDIIKATIVGRPRNWECKEMYLKLDEPSGVTLNNNNEIDDAAALREETGQLLKHLDDGYVQDQEGATPVTPLKEDREITKGNIARSPLSKIPEIGDDQVIEDPPNDDFVSVAVDTILEANNNVVEVTNPIPIEDKNEVVDDLIDISDEQVNDLPNEIVAEPMEEIEAAPESIDQDEPKVDDAIEPVDAQDVQAGQVEEIQAKVEEAEIIQVEEVEPQILETEPALVQVPEEPSIQIEAEKIEHIEEATPETADEIQEEIVAPPEEFGDTVNTLRSGQESPKHSFSSLELREYTDEVIRFTLNELRRDDFICTLISKRFNEQVNFQAK